MTNVGLHEYRTRVICHLPCNNASQEHAFWDITRYLHSQRTAAVPVTGYTHSTLRPALFRGYWWGIPDAKHGKPRAKKDWVEDRIIVLMIDYALDFSDIRLSQVLSDLKTSIVQFYKDNDSEQEEFWLIAQQIIRYA